MVRFGVKNGAFWGITHGEIFENMLRLICFGVYFENKTVIFI